MQEEELLTLKGNYFAGTNYLWLLPTPAAALQVIGPVRKQWLK